MLKDFGHILFLASIVLYVGGFVSQILGLMGGGGMAPPTMSGSEFGGMGVGDPAETGAAGAGAAGFAGAKAAVDRGVWMFVSGLFLYRLRGVSSMRRLPYVPHGTSDNI